MQSKYAPSQAFPACCPLQSLSELYLLFLPRLSSGYILCFSQDILLVLVFLLLIDPHLQFQRQCRQRQESRGSLLSSYTLDTILKLLQSPETQGIIYKRETITTFRISSTLFLPKSSQNPIDDTSLFCLYNDTFSYQVFFIKDDMSSSSLLSRIFFFLLLLFS